MHGPGIPSVRRCRSRIAGGPALTLLLALLPCAASADDWQDCNAFAVLERVLAGCSTVIAQGTRPPQDMAKAYVNRSIAYTRRGLLDQSLDDAESAIKVDPNSVDAIVNRGVVLRQKGRTDDALADANRALAIDATNANALGTARQCAGNPAGVGSGHQRFRSIDRGAP